MSEWKPKGTAMWIRDHLTSVGEDYVYGMWKRFRKEKEGLGYRAGSYQNFRRYIYMLQRLGLVQKTRTVKSKEDWMKDKNYYAVIAGKENHEGWENPQRVLYGD